MLCASREGTFSSKSTFVPSAPPVPFAVQGYARRARRAPASTPRTMFWTLTAAVENGHPECLRVHQAFIVREQFCSKHNPFAAAVRTEVFTVAPGGKSRRPLAGYDELQRPDCCRRPRFPPLPKKTSLRPPAIASCGPHCKFCEREQHFFGRNSVSRGSFH